MSRKGKKIMTIQEKLNKMLTGVNCQSTLTKLYLYTFISGKYLIPITFDKTEDVSCLVFSCVQKESVCMCVFLCVSLLQY